MTIQENLQTIADSTAAIKQAIIDKGGDASGDISTWAAAINGISGGGSGESEYTFTGTINNRMSVITITGSLNKVPDTNENYLLSMGWYTGGLVYDYCSITNTGPYTLSVDFDEPLYGNEVPAICILSKNWSTGEFTIIPINLILS